MGAWLLIGAWLPVLPASSPVDAGGVTPGHGPAVLGPAAGTGPLPHVGRGPGAIEFDAVPESAMLALPDLLEGLGVVLLVLLAAVAGYWFVREPLRRPSVEVVRGEPEVMFSDRDRILLLIERRGGRIRQRQIVEQVEWSKAKVSRLLSDLEEEGLVRKIRLGRENLVCLENRAPFGED